MPERTTLHVCHMGEKMPALHPCGKAAKALKGNGHDVEVTVYGKGKPFGIGVGGTRPELKEISGQEKLPVLELADGTVIAGSGKIVKWAKENPATA